MIREIFAAEINYEDAPVHLRETFTGSEGNIKSLLAEIRPLVDEVYILATRQRFTVYVVNESLQPLTDFFHNEHNLKGYVQYYYNSGESVTHLMATASGLLSSVKGEAGILGDIIRCYECASATSSLGITLDNTVRRAIETGRQVRVSSGIDHFGASVVETGLEVLYNRLENLHHKNFLIIGTGQLAHVALEYLCREGFSNIAITDRDRDRAGRVARKYGVKSFPLEALPDYFPLADVVLGVSHGQVPIELTAAEYDDTRRKECFILDFGIPPNFSGQWVEKYAADLYNLDDLRRMEPSPLDAFGGVEKAWRMVMKASNDFVHLLKLLHHSPVLTAYLNRQFQQKAGGREVKPKRTLKHILLFRKGDTASGDPANREAMNRRAHINNYAAENAAEIVRNFSHVRTFTYFICDN